MKYLWILMICWALIGIFDLVWYEEGVPKIKYFCVWMTLLLNLLLRALG